MSSLKAHMLTHTGERPRIVMFVTGSLLQFSIFKTSKLIRTWLEYSKGGAWHHLRDFAWTSPLPE